jgi:hypothetical protein
VKTLSLSELRDLLQAPEFTGWWTDLCRAADALRDARARHEELAAQSELMDLRSELAQRAAIDTFSAAGDAEDGAAKTSAEALALENRAIELVGGYEEQRLRTSDLWVRLGGAERIIEERREAVTASARDPARVRAHAETALEAAERQHELLKDEYGAGDVKRSKLWEDVEATWGHSFVRALVAAEQSAHVRQVRRVAARLFEEAEERRGRAKQLRADAEAAGRAVAEAEASRRALLARVAAELGCVAGDAFLYFGRRGDKRTAFAVALADDPDGANLEVKALGIYTAGRRGVASLEPAREGPPPTVEEGAHRAGDAVLRPREGAATGEEKSPASARAKP